jgi:hypothetical protein
VPTGLLGDTISAHRLHVGIRVVVVHGSHRVVQVTIFLRVSNKNKVFPNWSRFKCDISTHKPQIDKILEVSVVRPGDFVRIEAIPIAAVLGIHQCLPSHYVYCEPAPRSSAHVEP